MSGNQFLYRYTITLRKEDTGWRATCHPFPDIEVVGRGRNSTYKKMKWAIRLKVKKLIEQGEKIPRDNTQTKHFELDIRLLIDETMMR